MPSRLFQYTLFKWTVRQTCTAGGANASCASRHERRDLLGSSAVSRQRIKRLGRVIRRADGKHAAVLYYLYIRESTDDAIYLDTLTNHPVFDLRYYTAEGSFSNDLYEYAGRILLAKAGQKHIDAGSLKELRRCILEGLTRSDYLLPQKTLRHLAAAAGTTHERNYWTVMQQIHAEYEETGTDPQHP